MEAASNEAEKENRGVVVMKEKFIGPPLVKRARKVIESADLVEYHTKRRKNENGS